MFTESEVSRGLNLDKILKDFANVKARTISFSQQKQHLYRRLQWPQVSQFGLCVLLLLFCLEATCLFHSVLSLLSVA